MKNITNNTAHTRQMNGGMGFWTAMATIGGAASACKMAWDLGDWLGTKLGEAIFD